jgi:hypothetical protein
MSASHCSARSGRLRLLAWNTAASRWCGLSGQPFEQTAPEARQRAPDEYHQLPDHTRGRRGKADDGATVRAKNRIKGSSRNPDDSGPKNGPKNGPINYSIFLFPERFTETVLGVN